MTFLILICTLPERANQLKRLTTELDRQKLRYPGTVDYKINEPEVLAAGRNIPTGRKRNMLIEQSQSDYFSFIDDDDMVSDNYIYYIMNAIELKQPDVITFRGFMTTNGANRENFTIKLGSRYEQKNGHYYRFPNHLCAFKRDRVQHIKFPDQWIQEDYLWAKNIHDRGLLKTEVHIEADLYHYDCYPKQQVYARRAKIR